MKFFKPTIIKILLTPVTALFLFFLLWNVFSVPNCTTSPLLPGDCIASSHPMIRAEDNTLHLLALAAGVLAVSYILACVIVVLSRKLKKQPKNYTAKSKR